MLGSVSPDAASTLTSPDALLPRTEVAAVYVFNQNASGNSTGAAAVSGVSLGGSGGMRPSGGLRFSPSAASSNRRRPP